MLNFNLLEKILSFSQLFFFIVRIFSILSIAPVFSEMTVTKKTNFLLSIMISILITPFIPLIQITLFSMHGLLVLIEQVFIGIAIGFSIRFMFFLSNIAGEILGLQMGLSFSTFFDPGTQINKSVISRFLNLFLLLLFLSCNGHLWIILLAVKSFEILPIESIKLHNNLFYFCIKYMSKIYTNGIILSLPIIIILLGLNLIMGFFNRLSPQISLFSIGFPIILLSSILILFFSSSMICYFLTCLLKDILHTFTLDYMFT